MNLSRIISGTMNCGTWGVNYSKQEMRQLISESFDSGINSFDMVIYMAVILLRNHLEMPLQTQELREKMFFLYLNVV